MRINRRRFLKLGVISLGLSSVGYWITDHLTESSRAGAERPPSGQPQSGPWSRLFRLVDRRGRGAYPVHSILLPSGRMLMIGGAAHRFFEFYFDPGSHAQMLTVEPLPLPVDKLTDYFECAGHAYLADGRLLLAGGSRSEGGEQGLRYSMLFDPRGETWSKIERDMAGGPRWYPTVTRLFNSKLLVTAGFFDFGGVRNRSVELFDPVVYDAESNPWDELISDAHNRWGIEATGEDYTHVFALQKPIRLQGHLREVVMVGKSGVMHFMNVTDAFANPNDRFVVRPNSRRPGPRIARLTDASSSVLLPDGRIMVVGGSSNTMLQQKADIYDPVNDVWNTIDTRVGRRYPATLLLPDGTVLVVNGENPRNSPGNPRSPQIINPATGQVSTESPWPEDDLRGYHNTALLLPDGRVLLGGGGANEKSTPNNERTDVRYYSPRYLSVPALRPYIVHSPPQVSYGKSYVIGVANGPVDRATIIALGAMTHSFDQNQRFVELSIEENAEESVVVRGPADAFIAPPGDYMLFLLRRLATAGETVDVPSTARRVRVLAD
jgi:galactose oxidase